jgi:hypothetical protein
MPTTVLTISTLGIPPEAEAGVHLPADYHDNIEAADLTTQLVLWSAAGASTDAISQQGRLGDAPLAATVPAPTSPS